MSLMIIDREGNLDKNELDFFLKGVTVLDDEQKSTKILNFLND